MRTGPTPTYCSPACRLERAHGGIHTRWTGARREAIFERDGWTCGICREQIDSRLRFPDVLAATIDHIRPLSAGGSDHASNVQASHFLCNVRKSRPATGRD